MKLIFLGTSAGMATMSRNVTATALQWKAKHSRVWLFDCGEGTQHQFMKSSVTISAIDKIFITHLHGDHVFGLLGVLSSRSMQRIERPLQVFGPVGIRQYIETGVHLTDSHLTYSLEIIEIDAEGCIFEDEYRTVTAIPLHHRITCYGYRIEEKAHAGGLNTAALQKKGIAPSAIWGQLEKGQDVTVDSGEILRAVDWQKPDIPGRIVSIFGDNYPNANNVRLAQNATVMVHEASYADDLHHKAQEYLHATFSQVARLAQEAQVKQLIVTHISARYSPAMVKTLLERAQTIFPQIIAAHDFLEVEIPLEI